jgi:DNA-binding NarL/FixJ family response regulator
LLSLRRLPTKRITERERQVIGCILEGLPNKAIALRLNIKPTTAAAHVRRLFQKYDIHSRFDIALALLAGNL